MAADLPPSRRERIGSRLSDLARAAEAATSLDELKRLLVPELNRLAVGG